MLLVRKRDKTIEQFQREKIENAIQKAFESCNKEVDRDIIQCVEETFDINSDKTIDVEEIQDVVEDCLMTSSNTDVAKAYIIYRYNHKIIRESQSKLVKSLKKKLSAEDVQNQNANVDEYSFGGRMGEATRLVTKQYALDYCMSKKSRNNHLNNYIYQHDLDSYAVGMHNCLSIPIDDLLANGFNTRQCYIRKANSLNTAFQLLAVVFQLQSLQQFGGVSYTHLDWTLVPYFRYSFYKHFRDGMKYCENSTLENELKSNEIKDLSIDDAYYTQHEKTYQYALDMTLKELKQGVEGMYHNLNTLQSRSGCQLPFTSINYGTCTLTEGRYILKAILQGSINGVGKYHLTPIFPCGIFQCMKGVNRHPGDPNYDIFKLALESTSKRIYPNYVNVDWSVNEGYDRKDPRTYTATMGCHSAGTKIIMADGTKKNVEDVVVGDKLMGVNGETRTVQSLIKGRGPMFKVSQSRAESYVVNEYHILALQYSSSRKYKGMIKGDKTTMTLHDYINLPKNSRRFLKGYKVAYDLPDKKFEIPPYILGLWLGDGTKSNTSFSVNLNEEQIVEDLRTYAKSIKKDVVVEQMRDENCLRVAIGDKTTQHQTNVFRQALINLKLIDNKHIPEEYFYGSKSQRGALLAGLINSDGWKREDRGGCTICFGNTNLNLVNGVKRLADSLGYATRIIEAREKAIGTGVCEGCILQPYYHVSIHGFDDEKLLENKRLKRTRNSIRDFSTSTLTIEELPEDNFYGFELDGDKLYLINDNTVTHNCRTYNGYDINGLGQIKDGRGNLAPVTIILPTLAMELKQNLKEGDDIVKKFMSVLDKKIFEAKDMLLERYEILCKQSPKSASFMWENNTMYGYKPEEGIQSALKHGTLAIGQIALAETLQILIGKDQTTGEGMELAKKIEGLFQNRCKEFKEEYKLNFGVYYTPAENLCYTAFTKFKNTFGEVDNVTNIIKVDEDGTITKTPKTFFTNSIHVPVWKELTPFEKIDIESQLTNYSNAGCITYVELPSGTSNNIEALETIVNYAMDKDIPYFAINIPLDSCDDCGYQGEVNDTCPECGSHNISQLRRVTGYLTGNYKCSFNLGKQDETENRVKHMRSI